MSIIDAYIVYVLHGRNMLACVANFLGIVKSFALCFDVYRLPWTHTPIACPFIMQVVYMVC